MPVVNIKQIWTADIRAPRSMARIGFRSPSTFLPLSGGGGWVQNRGRISLTATMGEPGSTTREAIPEPPRLSTFKQRGGGPEFEVHLSDDCDG
jgi:hypothetical protein